MAATLISAAAGTPEEEGEGDMEKTVRPPQGGEEGERSKGTVSSSTHLMEINSDAQLKLRCGRRSFLF